MISMQQLEELENRIVKALQLINDLRSENAKYENENESLRSEVEEARLTLEEKEQEIQKIKKELDNATRELKEIKDREEVLEKKVIGLLGKLDMLQSASIPMGTPTSSFSADKKDVNKSVREPAPIKTSIVSDVPAVDTRSEVISSAPITAKEEKIVKTATESDTAMKVDDVSVETVDTSETMDSDDDDIIIIDDESDLDNDDIVLETHGDSGEREDEIILLDDDDDEIIIDDLDEDTIIIDEQEVSKKKPAKEPAKENKQKKTAKDDDDDFLIIEDDDK